MSENYFELLCDKCHNPESQCTCEQDELRGFIRAWVLNATDTSSTIDEATDEILAKVKQRYKEVVEDAGLTDKELNRVLGYEPRPAPQAGSMELTSAIFVARAQLQAILKAIDMEVNNG